jgi:hypothetical protein
MAAVSTNPARAVRLLAASRAIFSRIGSAGVPITQAEYDFIAERVKSALSADEYERVWAEGEAMKMEAAVEYALGGKLGGGSSLADGQ